MISLLGLKLGLLYPLAIAGIPVVLGTLIYAYLRRGRGNKVLVGSTLILKLIKSQSSSRRKFLPPLRFFFELLLMLLLLGAVGGFFIEDNAQRIAILIDNSLSMAAAEPAGAESLIDMARARAADFLRQLPSSARVELFAACPDSRSLSEGFGGANAALALLEEVKAEYCSDSLNAAARKLLAKDDYSKVVVLSDKALHETSDPNLNAKLLVITVQHPKAGSNLMLKSVEVIASPTEGSREIGVDLVSFANRSAQLDLRLEGYTALDKDEPLKLVGARRVSLAPGARETVKFKDQGDIYSAYRATLSPVPASEDLDQLSADNEGYLSLQTTKRRAVVISDLRPEDLGLNLIGWMKFDHVRPEAYAPEVLGTGDLLIFHRFVPATLPEANLLFVAPENSTPLFVLRNGLSNAEITSWNDNHPILNYLNLTLLNLREAKTLESPNAEALIKVGAGNVALAGRQGPYRFAVTGFELFPFEAKRAPTLSILTLNLLKWFLADSKVSQEIVPFQNFPVTTAEKSLVLVSGDRAPTPIVNLNDTTAAVDRPGLIVNANAADTDIRAVNFSDEIESDLRERGLISAAGEGLKGAARNERIKLASKLGVLVLLLLLADLVVTVYQARRISA
ncbi:MAG: VWA domain-containing protein [Oligoflexia bacterium]|nr:VWA domain-containing protein [Oligoflexia bacterium]